MKILKNTWDAWKKLAHKIGIFQSYVILTVFYFLLTPFGLFFSLYKDELKMKKRQNSTWTGNKTGPQRISDLTRQY